MMKNRKCLTENCSGDAFTTGLCYECKYFPNRYKIKPPKPPKRKYTYKRSKYSYEFKELAKANRAKIIKAKTVIEKPKTYMDYLKESDYSKNIKSHWLEKYENDIINFH